MSEFFKILVMSVIQGVAEFLPVSSSGHLALAKHFLGLESPGASLELFLHAGTLLSVIVYYRRKLLALLVGLFRFEKASLFYALWVLVSMIPAGLVFVMLGDKLEKAFDDPMLISALLCVTGLILISLYFVNRRPERTRPFNGRDALIMGLAQAVAMLPGISRSGSTICAGRFAGVKPSEAAEFSFIMSLPVIAGAVLVDVIKDGVSVTGLSTTNCVVGAAVAGVVGWLAIGSLVRILNGGKFWMFGVYCIAAGLASMALLALGV